MNVTELFKACLKIVELDGLAQRMRTLVSEADQSYRGSVAAALALIEDAHIGACEQMLERMAERTPDIVHVACINHRNGTNLYARRTEAALIAQIAEYCRTDWPTDLELPEDDAEAVDTYFEHMGDGGEEWLHREEINLGDA